MCRVGMPYNPRFQISYKHIYIYMVPPGAGQLSRCYPPPATTPTGAASHLPPSVKISHAHMLYLRSGFVPPMHYKTGYLHPVFTTAYNMPIQSIYNVLFLPIKYLYSRHIRYYQDFMCYTYVLATYYLYTTYIIPL